MRTVTEYDQMTDEELRALLITCDHKGKEVKEKALDVLLERKYDKGHQEGQQYKSDKWPL